MNNCCKNTDKEIWRQTHENYYSPSIHVTEQGTIGIKCGGHVIVATVQEWHNWGKEALLDAVHLDAEPTKPTRERLKCKDCKYSSSCEEEDDVRDVCKNYEPKQPEPATPEHFDCGGCKDRTSTQYHSCGYMCADWMHCVRTSSPLRCDWESKKPKSRPGLVPYPIIGGKGNELWIVDMPWGNSIALYKAVGRKDFDHIETKSGLDFEVLGAFNPNDPPIRAWFREGK